MRCLGRTTTFKRCKLQTTKWYFPFCKLYHWWQPVVLLFITIPAIISSYAGIYRDIIEPNNTDNIIYKGTKPNNAASTSVNSEVIFSSGNPIPELFDLISPGKPLSLVLSAYPDGKLSHIHGQPYYRVSAKNLFDFAQFFFFDTEADPPIEQIYYSYKKPIAKNHEQIKQAALNALGLDSVIVTPTGTLIWKDYKGFRVEVRDNSYWIGRTWEY